MKERIRTAMRVRLRTLDDRAAARGADSIVERLGALPEWAASRTVFAFLSLPFEVSTRALIERAWAENRRVAVPRLSDESGRMEAVEFHDYGDLVPARFGLMELPNAPVVAPSEIDLVVSPGLAFDRAGRRLGQGAGYYDRYLPRLRDEVPVVAICFSEQLVDEVPTDAHDLAVDAIVTPDEVIRSR